MIRTLIEKHIVIASHNRSKTQEISSLLASSNIKVVTAIDLYLPVPKETGITFFDNAALKALSATAIVGLPALADDSGLIVQALNGEPGVYSARWSRCKNDFTIAMARVHAALGGVQIYYACFVCALALAWPDKHIEIFEGTVKGILTWPPRGSNGFGYDSIFQPLGYQITFAEMDLNTKHTISHRANAFCKLNTACFSSVGDTTNK